MSKAQHTPGPWHRNIRAGGKYPIIFAGRNTHVAMAKGHNELLPDEIEANIDLIAAAPELLEALQGCIDELELHEKHARDTGDMDLLARLNRARAAIAKAKGE